MNPFKTRYFSWVDVGCFRHLTLTNDTKVKVKPFNLYLPPNFNTDSVAYSEVARSHNLSALTIFMKNLVWLSGSFFVGSVDVLNVWVREYRLYAEHFISQGLSNTDQQVIYAMFNGYKPVTRIQQYRGAVRPWFYLSYLCKAEGEKRQAGSSHAYASATIAAE